MIAKVSSLNKNDQIKNLQNFLIKLLAPRQLGKVHPVNQRSSRLIWHLIELALLAFFEIITTAKKSVGGGKEVAHFSFEPQVLGSNPAVIICIFVQPSFCIWQCCLDLLMGSLQYRELYTETAHERYKEILGAVNQEVANLRYLQWALIENIKLIFLQLLSKLKNFRKHFVPIINRRICYEIY